MNVTITAPDTITCPTWCHYTVEQHALHSSREHPDDKPMHASGPRGRFEFWQIEGQPITATLIGGISNNTDLTPADLRHLAQDALAAAEWLASVEGEQVSA